MFNCLDDSWLTVFHTTVAQFRAFDLSANVQLHTLVVLTNVTINKSRTRSLLDDIPLCHLLNTIRPGVLRRIMLRVSIGLNHDHAETFSSYASLLSQPRFQSLTDIYLVRTQLWHGAPHKQFEESEKEVETAFAALIARGVAVKLLMQRESCHRAVVDQWEQDTLARGD